MRHQRGSYLSQRLAYLLTYRLPCNGLPQSPDFFAGNPAGGFMDVLSEVLKVVKLQGPSITTENFPRRGVFARHPLG